MLLRRRSEARFSLPKFVVLQLVIIFLLGTSGCSDSDDTPRSRTAFYFGTPCTITLLERAPESTYNRVFTRLEEIERRMSITLEASEVSQINREAGIKAVRVSRDTFHVIEQGVQFSQLTGGGFDISVGPLVTLWNIGSDHPVVPAPERIREKLSLVGFQHIRLDRETREVFLEERGMMLDLGGIAKGYAAEEAGRILAELGIRRAIVDIGGNILVLGSKPGNRPWRVGVQDPLQPRGAYCGILELKASSAVTSGVYERFFEIDGRRYHHILDTGDGYPVENDLLSVTIVSRDSLTADALSTGLFVFGLQKGMRVAEQIEGLEAVFVTKDRRIHLTSGLPGLFTLTASGYFLE